MVVSLLALSGEGADEGGAGQVDVVGSMTAQSR